MILSDIDQSVEHLQIIPEARIAQLGSVDGLPDYRTVVHVIDESGLNAVEVAQLRSQLGALVDSFGKEGRHFLQELNQAKYRWYCIGNEYRKRRDQLVAAGYKPQTQLQARMWKMALQASSIIVSNYWRLSQVKALEAMRQRPYFNRFTQEERTYVFSMLGSLSRSFFEMLDGTYPILNSGKEKNLAWKTRKYLCQEMVRQIRAVKGRAPVHDEHRSVWFDAQCYSQTMLKDSVELSVMTLERGKRLKFRIKGTMPVRSTIKIVHRQNGSFAVHVMHPLKVKEFDLQKIVPDLPKGHLYATALDMGYTEVWTDFKGVAYGEGLGKVLKEYAEAVNKKIAARNKVLAAANKTKDPVKRRKILRSSYGEKSFAEMTRHYRIRIENIINAGINKLMRESPAQVYIVEDLSHRFDYGNLPKPIRRRLSGWVKGVIRDRMLFKAAAHGAKIVMVPCSYSSQRCSECGYTDRENRHGDKFKCRHCGAQKQADANGAVNLLLRAYDERYRRFMRKEEVWALERAEYEAGCMKREEKPLPNPKKAKRSTAKSQAVK